MTDETTYTKEDINTALNDTIALVMESLDADLSKLTTDEREKIRIFEAMDNLLTEITEEMVHSDLEEDSPEYIDWLRDNAIKMVECLEILKPKMVTFFAELDKFYLNGLKNQESKQSNQTNQTNQTK